MKLRLINIIAAISIFMLSYSCSSFLEIDPPVDRYTPDALFNDAELIKTAANGIYAGAMVNTSITMYMPIIATSIADDMTHNKVSTSYGQFWANTYTAVDAYVTNFWRYFYEAVYTSNSFIDEMAKVNEGLLTEAETNTYLSDALFFRAYSHLMLTLFWGNVPYITSSDAKISSKVGQSTQDQVLNNVVEDLKDIESKLAGIKRSTSYVTEHAARALLARVYLYQKNWTDAVNMATKVINESGAELDEPSNVFLHISLETIFHLSHANNPDNDRYDGYTYTGSVFNSSSYAYIRPELHDSFEPNDIRKSSWTYVVTSGTFEGIRSSKYKQNGVPADPADIESLKMLRIAEQYLIRAEAYINLDKLVDATNDINKIRERSGLTPLSANLSKGQLFEALIQERRVELFAEDCHRWTDIRRWGIVDEVFAPIADKSKWNSNAALLPIPQDELDRNSNLVPNPGY